MENRSQDQHTTVMVVSVVIIALSGLLVFLGNPVPSKCDEIPVAVKDQNNIPLDPAADGTGHEVTLYPPDLGSLPWAVGEDSICDLLFRAPVDKGKWVRLNIKKKEHFKGFYIGIDDHSGGLSSEVIEAENFKPTDQIKLRTRSFKADIDVIEAKIGSDPDSENRDGKVFEEVLLRIIVAEQ